MAVKMMWSRLLVILTFVSFALAQPFAVKHSHGHRITRSQLHRRSAGTNTYTVVGGDTGNAISAAYSISFAALNSSNPNVKWNALQVGQVLTMPSNRAPISYTVVSGDSLSSIAAKFDVVDADIKTANTPTPSITWDSLQPGTNLRIPGYGSCTTYAVTSGDYGYLIASAYSITFDSLSAANPNVNWNALQIGQVLRVPAGTSPSTGTLPSPAVCASSSTSRTTVAMTTSTITTTTTTTTKTTTSITSSATTSSSPTTLVTSTTRPSTSSTPVTTTSTSSATATNITWATITTTSSTISPSLSSTVPTTSKSTTSTATSPTTSTTSTTTSKSTTATLSVSATLTSSTKTTTSPSSSTTTTSKTTTSVATSKTSTITTTTSSKAPTTTTTNTSTISSKSTTSPTTSKITSTSTSSSSKTASTSTTSTSTGSSATGAYPTVTGANYVSGGINNDGVASHADTYTFYQGDGSTAAGWPAKSQWVSFATMWNNISPYLGKSCLSIFGVPNNSDAENQQIYDAIQSIASQSGVDHRFILAVIVQESSGCVRVNTTMSADKTVRNPGLMQDFNGSGSCNNNVDAQTPCPSSQITQMIRDGTSGTSSDSGKTYTTGLVQNINSSPSYTDAQVIYRAARIYNSGSVPTSNDLGAPGATRCYASDIANRLMGWISAARTCTLTG